MDEARAMTRSGAAAADGEMAGRAYTADTAAGPDEEVQMEVSGDEPLEEGVPQSGGGSGAKGPPAFRASEQGCDGPDAQAGWSFRRDFCLCQGVHLPGVRAEHHLDSEAGCFGVAIHVDLKYMKDVASATWVALSMVDAEANYHIATLIRTHKPFYVSRKFIKHWVAHFGSHPDCHGPGR